MLRRIGLSVALFLLVACGFALPAFNPWTRHWVFEFDDEVYNFRCDGTGKCQDLDTGEEYWYDWDTITDILTLFDFRGRDWNFKVEFPGSDYEAIGYEVHLRIDFTAYAAY